MECIQSQAIFRPFPLTPVRLHPAPPSFYRGKILLQTKATAPCLHFTDVLAAHHCRTSSLHFKKPLSFAGKGQSWEAYICHYIKISTENIGDLMVTCDIGLGFSIPVGCYILLGRNSGRKPTGSVSFLHVN